MKKESFLIKKIKERYPNYFDKDDIENFENEIIKIKLRIKHSNRIDNDELITRSSNRRFFKRPSILLKDFKDNLNHLVRKVNRKQKEFISMA